MADRKKVLIVSISARALCQAARRSGFEPYAVDFFADADLRDAVCRWRKMPGLLEAGFQENSLIAALSDLSCAAGPGVAGVVYGAGFEDRPHLLETIASTWRLFGNGSETSRSVKDPAIFFGMLERLDVPFLDYQLTRPADLDGWVYKKRGGAGGGHIVNACAGHSGHQGTGYFQKFAVGDAVSALVLGNGEDAMVLGLSDQWSMPASGAPMRFGGACRPSVVGENVGAKLCQAALKIVAAFGLVGLNSVDFLVGDFGYVALEVNGRPGASLSVFDSVETPLFQLHLDACGGVLPDLPLGFTGAKALAEIYAPFDFIMPRGFSWPDWCVDRPVAGEAILAGAPFCTVLAEKHGPGEAKKLLRRYSHDILDKIGTYINIEK